MIRNNEMKIIRKQLFMQLDILQLLKNYNKLFKNYNIMC